MQARIKTRWVRLDVWVARMRESSTVVFKASSVAMLGDLLALDMVYVVHKLHWSSIGRLVIMYKHYMVAR